MASKLVLCALLLVATVASIHAENEETNSDLEARDLHTDDNTQVEKRGDWSYGGSVGYRHGNHNFGGSISHSNGRTSGGFDYNYNGKRMLEDAVAREARSLVEAKRQWTYGGSVGYRHGNHNFGGSVSHSNGRTSGGFSYRYDGKRMLEDAVAREARSLVLKRLAEEKRQWNAGLHASYNRGPHSFGAHVNHGAGGTSAGLSYSYRFKRMLEDAVRKELKRQLGLEQEE